MDETKIASKEPAWSDLMAMLRSIVMYDHVFARGFYYKNAAGDAGITPAQAWVACYRIKHDSICYLVKEEIFERDSIVLFADAIYELLCGCWPLEVQTSPMELLELADNIALAKGRDYTKGTNDRTANFKEAAISAGISPMQAWLVFYQKHHAAICNYAKSGGQSESEPILQRLADALNYLRLGWLIVRETVDAARPLIENPPLA
jgi:hypothetical protein